MRLIDADVFIEYLGLNAESSREDNLGEIVSLEDFDRQPTAYDVDRVVEQLEEMRDTITRNISLNSQGENIDEEILNEIRHYQKIIKIIKSGGIE